MDVWVLYHESGEYSDYSMAILGVYATREAGMLAVRPLINQAIARDEAHATYAEQWIARHGRDEWNVKRATDYRNGVERLRSLHWTEADDDDGLRLELSGKEDFYTLSRFAVLTEPVLPQEATG